MAEKGNVKIKNGEIEFIKFGRGERTLVILPGLSYDGFFEQAAYSCFCALIFTPGPMVEAVTQDRMYWPLAAAGLALMMAPSSAT